MAPIFTGFRFGFGGGATGGVIGFDTLVATDVYTSPFTSSSRTYTKLEFILVGAGGADNNPWPAGQPLASAQTGGGGQGGFTVARFVVPTSTTLLYAVGSTGSAGEPGPGAGGNGWLAGPGNLAGGSGFSKYVPAPGSYGGGGGGGATGVFVTSVSQADALAIAGGGGGNRYSGGIGGNGGGLTADSAPSPGTGGGGGGGSQVAGGAGGVDQPGTLNATSGIALGGGNNGAAPTGGAEAYGGGGGGGGYFGGGGGGASSTTSGANSAGGGGGSGFINSSSPLYVLSPTVERNYTGMGDPAMGTGAGGPYPLGAGKDHPQISPYWLSVPTKYGAGAMPGILLVNYYI